MIFKFQEGGAVPMEQAPQEGGADQMMAQLEQMAGAIIQELGPEGAMALAEMLMQLAQGGGEAEQVAYNKNGKKIMKRKKCASGAKMKKC